MATSPEEVILIYAQQVDEANEHEANGIIDVEASEIIDADAGANEIEGTH